MSVQDHRPRDRCRPGLEIDRCGGKGRTALVEYGVRVATHGEIPDGRPSESMSDGILCVWGAVAGKHRILRVEIAHFIVMLDRPIALHEAEILCGEKQCSHLGIVECRRVVDVLGNRDWISKDRHQTNLAWPKTALARIITGG